jgi:Alginate lyase
VNRRQLLLMPVALAAESRLDIVAIERARVLRLANQYLKDAPVTVTASHSPRGTGGEHDYFSEGDYWWPDPKNPGGPYIQRDGMSNPDNFDDHRKALMRLSVHAPALSAAWAVTKDRQYAAHAADHLRAWFLNEKTRMNPNLQYAQAIHGRFSGRGTGIIDTIHLVEVVRGASAIENSGALSNAEIAGLKKWFSDYVTWMTGSKNGIQERDAANNHATCWVMQAAEFARYAGASGVTADCNDRFKTKLIPQMAADGSYPRELARTKPYGYSLFNLEAMSTVSQILDLWDFTLPDGRGMAKALAYMYPFIRDKKKWALKPDVMYFDQWPVRQESLLFGGLAYGKPEYLELWKKLNPDPKVEETIRNYPIRQPVLWLP